MSEERLWKQIKEIITTSDDMAGYEAAILSGNMGQAHDLLSRMSFRQLNDTQGLLDETMKHLKEVLEYSKGAAAIGDALLKFIDHKGLVAEFTQWAMRRKGLEPEFRQMVKNYKEKGRLK